MVRSIALIAALAGAACATGQQAVPAATGAVASPAATRSWTDSVMATLSPRDRAAQLVWPQLFGDFTSNTSASWARIERMISQDHVGGFIMSIGSPIETAAKLNAMQRRSALPLLVSADYETGAGFRTRGGYFLPNGIYLGGATIFPPQMALGATRDSSLAYEQGRITAVEGRAVGVHIAFAPVLDVNNNPGNPVIGARSFGEDPALVARMGASLIRGLQEHGMIANAKHFPGHGDTEQNSHLTITTVTASRPRLDSVELVPFRRAIEAGVGSIMTFHGVIPALDTTPVPATLSPVVMTELLRRQLGFTGLLVTDALDMTGVLAQVKPTPGARVEAAGSYGAVPTVGLAEVVKQAVVAGSDILLMPLDVTVAIDAVVAGVREGRFTQERVDASVRRVLEMKERLGLHRHRTVDLDSVPVIVADTANMAVAARIAERSMTLVRNRDRVLPVASGKRILSITVANRMDLGAGTTFDAALRAGGATVRTERVDPASPDVSIPRLLALMDSADVTIVSSYLGTGTTVSSTGAPTTVVELIRRASTGPHAGRLAVVAFGNPYFLREIPDVGSYLIAWGGFPVSQRAAGQAVMSGAVPGRLPITISRE